MTKFDYMLE